MQETHLFYCNKTTIAYNCFVLPPTNLNGLIQFISQGIRKITEQYII